MELSFISRESIKPSIPMYNHESFKLSLLDQLLPRSYTPFVYFYRFKKTSLMETKSRLDKLKTSLSKTLNFFYTMSGRVHDNLFISDYMEGVPFIEARVKGQLLDFLQNPKLELLSKFVPYESICLLVEQSLPQVAVQANIFDCEGMALGVSFLHKLGDGITAISFLKTWAAFSSGCSDKVIKPNLFDASLVFPPLEPPPSVTTEDMFFRKGRFSTRRFVFDENAITAITRKSKSEVAENPSPVQSLLAFIWKSAMSASKSVHHRQRPSVLAQAKNIRRVTQPRCSKHAIGNLFLLPITRVIETEMEPNDLVIVMKEALDHVNSDFLKPMSILEEFNGSTGLLGDQNCDMFVSSSWTSFGFNEIDFGWGKPVWLGLFGKTSETYPCLQNFVVINQVVGNNNALEAWVSLDEELIGVLDNDHEFLAFASSNPAISIVHSRL